MGHSEADLEVVPEYLPPGSGTPATATMASAVSPHLQAHSPAGTGNLTPEELADLAIVARGLVEGRLRDPDFKYAMTQALHRIEQRLMRVENNLPVALERAKGEAYDKRWAEYRAKREAELEAEEAADSRSEGR